MTYEALRVKLALTVLEHGHTFVLASLVKEMFHGINLLQWLQAYGLRISSRNILHLTVIDFSIDYDNDNYLEEGEEAEL